MAAVCGRGKVGKSGKVELDSIVLAEVDADGEGVAVGVDDRVDVEQIVLKNHMKLFHGQI